MNDADCFQINYGCPRNFRDLFLRLITGQGVHHAERERCRANTATVKGQNHEVVRCSGPAVGRSVSLMPFADGSQFSLNDAFGAKVFHILAFSRQYIVLSFWDLA